MIERNATGETAQCRILLPIVGILCKMWGGRPRPRRSPLAQELKAHWPRCTVNKSVKGRRGRRPRTRASAPQVCSNVEKYVALGETACPTKTSQLYALVGGFLL